MLFLDFATLLCTAILQDVDANVWMCFYHGGLAVISLPATFLVARQPTCTGGSRIDIVRPGAFMSAHHLY